MSCALCSFISARAFRSASIRCCSARLLTYPGMLQIFVAASPSHSRPVSPNPHCRSMYMATEVACAKSLLSPTPAPELGAPSTQISAALPASKTSNRSRALPGVRKLNGSYSTLPPSPVRHTCLGKGHPSCVIATTCPASCIAARRRVSMSGFGAILSAAACKCAWLIGMASARASPKASRTTASATAPVFPRS